MMNERRFYTSRVLAIARSDIRQLLTEIICIRREVAMILLYANPVLDSREYPFSASMGREYPLALKHVSCGAGWKERVMRFRRFVGMALRLGVLLALATVACGQVREQPAHVWIETTTSGELRGTLTVAIANVPAGLPAAFARALGCDVPDLKKSSYESRIVVQCPRRHPSALTFHADVRLADLVPVLRQAGVASVDVLITTAYVSSLRVEPAMTGQVGQSGRYYRAHYPLDQVP